MKLLNMIFRLALLLITITGCQDDDNFLVKEEAFAMITSGFNGSDSELDITIDTMALTNNPIQSNANFNRVDKYTFPPAKDSVMFLIKERKSGNLVYQKSIKRGEYSTSIQLIYVGGKLIEKPVAPEKNPDGIRLVSYLFLPRVTGYSGDIDIVYYKKYEAVVNGQLALEKVEELARITAKPYVFSEFLKAPIFPGGRNEIDGKIYFTNPLVMFYKSGTNIPYHEDAGFTLRQYATIPLPFNVKPQIVGIAELGSIGESVIEAYQQIQF